MRLNILLNRHRKKKDNESKDIGDIGKFAWATPKMILVYLKNAIELYTPNHEVVDGAAQNDGIEAEEPLKFKLQPWFEFKNVLFDIYDHRIMHAPEINGGVNTNYTGMEEHLICYFIEKHKLRPETERQLIEFMASLKYYAEIWSRAKLFA